MRPVRRATVTGLFALWLAPLPALAKARSRDTSDIIINEASEAWLKLQDWQGDHIRQGLAAADAGDFATDDGVSAVLDRWIARPT
jgi:predicted transcriptional regulator